MTRVRMRYSDLVAMREKCSDIQGAMEMLWIAIVM